MPLPPRQLLRDDPTVSEEPYFSQTSFKWSDPVTDRLVNYMERSVKLQRTLMDKAGETDPRNCNLVEMELRLGQLTTRKTGFEDKGRGVKHEGKSSEDGAKQQTPNVHRGRQNRVAETLLRLPVASPAAIDEQMCSFLSGFKLNGRCDSFFTIPVKAIDSDHHFTEVSNKFIDQRVFDWEVNRIGNVIAQRKAHNDDEDVSSAHTELSASSHQHQFTDDELAYIFKTHRWQSSVDGESHLPPTLIGKEGNIEGCLMPVTLGRVDPKGSDQIPWPPLTWQRKTRVHAAATANGDVGTVYESEGDATTFELHAMTNDGYRVQYTNGAVVTTGPRAKKIAKDQVTLERLKDTNELASKNYEFTKTLTPGDVKSTIKRTESGLRDTVLGAEMLTVDGRTLVSPNLCFSDIRIASKAAIAHSSFRMPNWCADVRMSVAIERTKNDDQTPFDINLSEMFVSDVERSYTNDVLAEAIEGSRDKVMLEQRLQRNVTMVRFAKRTEYRLLEVDVGFETIRRYRRDKVMKWFGLEEPKEETVSRLNRVGSDDSVTLSFDPIADNFLKLIITDVYSSLDPGHVKTQRTELHVFSDIRRSAEAGFLHARPTSEDHRLREVEVEVNMVALMEAVMARDKKLKDDILRMTSDESMSVADCHNAVRKLEQEASMQKSELYTEVSQRMLDALGSFAKLP